MNKTYKGTVKRIEPYGAFVEILPGQDGLLHISEMAHSRVGQVTDVMQLGDEVEVQVVGIEPDTGKIRLSRKPLLPPPTEEELAAARDRVLADRVRVAVAAANIAVADSTATAARACREGGGGGGFNRDRAAPRQGRVVVIAVATAGNGEVGARQQVMIKSAAETRRSTAHGENASPGSSMNCLTPG